LALEYVLNNNYLQKEKEVGMKKYHITVLIVVVVLVAGVVLADTTTLSTYYPAPYGRYRQFSTTGLTTLATDEFGNEGPTALVGIGTTDPTQQLEITESFQLPKTTASDEGVVYKGGDRFIHDYTAAGANGRNTFIGINAGNFTMVAGSPWEASYNTAVGYNSLFLNTTGRNNAALGYQALRANTSGYYNSAFGYEALYSANTGHDNTAVGYRALYKNTSGHSSCAMGRETLYNSTTAIRNCAVGNQALYDNVTGNQNSVFGYRAGMAITSGNNNTFVGYNAGYGLSQRVEAVNSMALGAETYTTLNNQVVIGNTNIEQTLLRGNVGIETDTPTTDANPNGDTIGNLDVADVWLRGANGGSGAWASEAGGAVFGTYTEVDTNSNTLVDGVTYLAQSDGLLTSFHGGRTTRAYVNIVKANVDSQNFAFLRIAGTAGQFVNGMYGGVTVPVAKNEYVRIAASDNNGGEKIGWMPFGSGGLVRQ